MVDAEDDDCEDDEMQCRASVPDCMSHAESAIKFNVALERADAADDEVVTMEVEELDDPFAELDENVPLLDGLRKLITAEDLDEMTNAARDGLALLPSKNKGSVTYGRKHKSLKERWMTREAVPVTVDEANPGQVFVERNTQVKVEVQQGKGKKARSR